MVNQKGKKSNKINSNIAWKVTNNRFEKLKVDEKTCKIDSQKVFKITTILMKRMLSYPIMKAQKSCPSGKRLKKTGSQHGSYHTHINLGSLTEALKTLAPALFPILR